MNTDGLYAPPRPGYSRCRNTTPAMNVRNAFPLRPQAAGGTLCLTHPLKKFSGDHRNAGRIVRF
jgi:hypothetical protein